MFKGRGGMPRIRRLSSEVNLSYDISGSYFDLDMSLLEKDCAYYVKLVYYVNGKYSEQPEAFKFRIE